MGKLTAENIIKLMQEHSLVARCLPHVVISNWTYRDGDENRKWVYSNSVKRYVVTENLDLDYFKKTPLPTGSSDSPEKRYENYKKRFPNGRKFLREERTVDKGGWWYVKEVHNTDSMVLFDRKHDKFFAPTLEEAMLLYLDSIGYKLEP